MTEFKRASEHRKRSVQETFFRSVLLSGFTLTALTVVVLSGLGHPVTALGVLTGAAWGFLSGYFLFRLVCLCIEPGKNPARTIAVFTVLKFPVLYLAGYAILKSRYFPIVSLLGGLTIFLFAFMVAWFSMNIRTVLSAKGTS